ncbi:hypothetical protein NC651_007417 [Populus alba x Populus x berolinensis]|nr:hypothetical protein NC651_007417 [Populus alba x Populus x berolinensis]
MVKNYFEFFQIAQISAVENLNDDDDEDEEPTEKLLELFGKDQLINLLREAANGHKKFTDKIRQVAGQDPVRRKIFIHGLGWDTNDEALMNAFKPVLDPLGRLLLLHKHSNQFWSYLSNVGANLDPQKLMSFFSEFREIEEGPLGHDKPYPMPGPIFWISCLARSKIIKKSLGLVKQSDPKITWGPAVNMAKHNALVPNIQIQGN